MTQTFEPILLDIVIAKKLNIIMYIIRITLHQNPGNNHSCCFFPKSNKRI